MNNELLLINFDFIFYVRYRSEEISPSDHRSAIKVPFYIGRLVVATRSDAKWPSGSSGCSGSHANVVAYKWFPCQCQVNTVTGGVDRGAIWAIL